MSTAGRIRTLSSRSCFAWLVILALLFRGLVPLGYMPDFSKQAHGFFPITICSGYDRTTIFLDKDFNKVEPVGQGKTQHQHDDRTFCPFSVSSIFASAETPEFVSVALAFIFAVAVYTPFQLVRQRFFANTSPART